MRENIEVTMDTINIFPKYEVRSPWLKTTIKRMVVFNGQIFNDIYALSAKDNILFNLAHLDRSYRRLLKKVQSDPKVSKVEEKLFTIKYNNNLQLLYHKKLKKTEQPSFEV